MIKKQMSTTLTETWSRKNHRYVFRRQWQEGDTENKENHAISVILTIRPTTTACPYIEDLTMLLIEKNVRKLGFTGFIAVNLFSSIEAKNKATFKKGNDENSQEVFQTVLSEKRVKQIIFACGSITKTNQLAMDQAKIYYELLTAKQKKMTKVLVDSSGSPAHPLNVQVRNDWLLTDVKAMFGEV